MKRWKICLSSILFILLCIGCGQDKTNSISKKNDNPIIEEIPNSDKSMQNSEFESKEPFLTNVVFYNHIPLQAYVPEMQEEQPKENGGYVFKREGGYAPGYSDNYSQVISFYDETAYDEEQLFAFCVRIGAYIGRDTEFKTQKENESDDEYYWRWSEYIKDVLRKQGLYIIEDYPYSFDMRRQMGIDEYPENYMTALGIACNYSTFAIAGKFQDIVRLCEKGEDIDGFFVRFLSAMRPDMAELAAEAGYIDFWDYHRFVELTFGDTDEVILEVNVS